MILLWSERKLLARIVFISTFSPIQVSLVSSLFVFFAVGHCLEQFIIADSAEQFIIADSAKQFRLRMRSSLFYWQPLLFFSLQFCPDLRGFGLKRSGLARFYCTSSSVQSKSSGQWEGSRWTNWSENGDWMRYEWRQEAFAAYIRPSCL